MTELEARRMLGWPASDSLDFIMAGVPTMSYRIDWLVVKCSVCPYQGYTVPELLSEVCIGCGNKNLVYEEAVSN
jgi:hypothetical protein